MLNFAMSNSMRSERKHFTSRDFLLTLYKKSTNLEMIGFFITATITDATQYQLSSTAQ